MEPLNNGHIGTSDIVHYSELSRFLYRVVAKHATVIRLQQHFGIRDFMVAVTLSRRDVAKVALIMEVAMAKK